MFSYPSRPPLASLLGAISALRFSSVFADEVVQQCIRGNSLPSLRYSLSAFRSSLVVPIEAVLA